MEKQELIEQLNVLMKQEKEIRQKLDDIEYENRLADAKQYKGKYFKEVDRSYKESIRCLFVYSIDKERCEPMALSISYWSNNEASWFDIQYHSHFQPKKWEDSDEWVEISKEEYMQHYEQVQRRISLAISSKNNN